MDTFDDKFERVTEGKKNCFISSIMIVNCMCQ